MRFHCSSLKSRRHWPSFFVGGLLNLVAVPLSSFCLILDDLNGELLIDISAMAQQNFSGAPVLLVETTLRPSRRYDHCLGGELCESLDA